MRSAMKNIEKHTCIKFVERSDEDNFIFIHSGAGCSSRLGMIGGSQNLSLKKSGCFSRGTIIHELFHALGYSKIIKLMKLRIFSFFVFSGHMHNHVDREKFVKILWENIKSEKKSNFAKVDPRRFGNFETSYDMHSVTHYNRKSFSSNGQDTIIARNPKYQKIMGQRKGMSRGDIKRIKKMYECE